MANPTADLFGTPVLPGLEYRDALLSRDEETALIALIDEQDLAPFQFQGWLGKRLTRSFGWYYDFDTSRFGETDPLPDWLVPIRERAAAFAKLPEEALVQALLIRYDPGAGIGWHRDRPVFEHVVGISLGVPATMRFRRRTASGFDCATVPLAPRSVYHLSGEARHDWEHSIAEMEVTRWSITFRSFTDRARQDRR
jgi:alkylated DNA repair dioxygenase AlkB